MDVNMKNLLNIIKSKSAFTLVELIITIAIAGVVIVPISLLVASGLRNTVTTEKYIAAMQDAQQAFIIINEAIRSQDQADVYIDDNYLNTGIQVLVTGNNVYYIDVSKGLVRREKSDTLKPEIIIIKSTKFTDYNFEYEANTSIANSVIKVTIDIDSNGDGLKNDSYEMKFYKRQ